MRILIFILFFIFGATSRAQDALAMPDSEPGIGFSIIKTSKVSVQENLLKPGGSMLKKVDSNFSAFLIKHHQDYFLFDTGLGRHIDAQYDQDMPLWQRLLFNYDKPVIPAREQLDHAGFKPIKNVLISHSHWDHAGGVLDFPEAQISVSEEEMMTIGHPTTGAGGTWASQVASKAIQWNRLVFKKIDYKGFEKSLDLFGDGSIIIVPMPGHTAGSIGMFITVDSGKCYFFIGDVAWTVDAVKVGRGKFWAAGLFVDHAADQTLASVNQVRDLMRKHPEMIVLPAHDASVQGELGYFPKWIK